jgi:hypothetical protein
MGVSHNANNTAAFEQGVAMGNGYDTDYSKWDYDERTRMWSDETGNQYQSLPVGVQIGDTKYGKAIVQDTSDSIGDNIYRGVFNVKRYAEFIRQRIRRVYDWEKVSKYVSREGNWETAPRVRNDHSRTYRSGGGFGKRPVY